MYQIQMRNGASENPFYGKQNLFALYNETQKGNVNATTLAKAWDECKLDLDLRKMFWTVLFAAGDVPNREHAGLPKTNGKLEQGGSGQRNAFRLLMDWAKRHQVQQYERFLHSGIIQQYVGFDQLLDVRVKTKVGTKTALEVINTLDGVDLDVLATQLARSINRMNEGEKVLLAKRLTNVRLSRRQKVDRKTKEKTGHRDLTETVVKNNRLKERFYTLLSEKMGWEVNKTETFTDFIGLREWKRQYNGELESVLFSSGKIREYDQIQFFQWLDKLPSGARYRVRRRLLNKDNSRKGKWVNKFGKDFGTLFLEWEKSKEASQERERELLEKSRQTGKLSDAEQAELKAVKKAAKVNTGATDLYADLKGYITGTMNLREFELKVNDILKRIIFQVPALVIADVSGSMSGEPERLAAFLATVALLKNPSEELANHLVTFGSDAHFYTDGAIGVERPNKFMQVQSVKVNKLVDRTKGFMENFESISKIVNSIGSSTNFASVAGAFEIWVNSEPAYRQMKVEQLQQYPVFILISDGDLNNQSSPAKSMMEFQAKMRHLGWEGVVVVWEVGHRAVGTASKYTDVPNVLHLQGFNLANVNQVFTKLNDLEVIDVYSVLKSLSQSNRYVAVQSEVI
jgi:hypothetical protein